MAKKKYEFIDPSKATSIPVPRDLTPEEEDEILQCFQEQLDSTNLEAECLELFRQAEQGKLVSAGSLLEELEQEDRIQSGEDNGEAIPA